MILKLTIFSWYQTDLDVTGSPLKCPFNNDFNFQEISPFVIKLDEQVNRNIEVLSYTPIPIYKAM